MTAIYQTIEFNSFEKYYLEISQIPEIPVSIENDMVSEYQKTNNAEIYKKIVLSNLRYVMNIAKNFNGYGLPIFDLVQSGAIGLMKAIPNYKQSEGCNFKTIAKFHIRAEILEFVLNNYRIIKIATTKAKRKLFFNIKKLKNSLVKDGREWLSEEDIQVVSEKLNVDSADVVEMEKSLYLPHYNLDNKGADEDDDFDRHTIISSDETLESSIIDIMEDEEKKKLFVSAFNKLSEKEQDVLKRRYFQEQPETYASIGKSMGISGQRVDQYEKGAIKKMKAMIEEGIK